MCGDQSSCQGTHMMPTQQRLRLNSVQTHLGPCYVHVSTLKYDQIRVDPGISTYDARRTM